MLYCLKKLAMLRTNCGSHMPKFRVVLPCKSHSYVLLRFLFCFVFCFFAYYVFRACLFLRVVFVCFICCFCVFVFVLRLVYVSFLCFYCFLRLACCRLRFAYVFVHAFCVLFFGLFASACLHFCVFAVCFLNFCVFSFLLVQK